MLSNLERPVKELRVFLGFLVAPGVIELQRRSRSTHAGGVAVELPWPRRARLESRRSGRTGIERVMIIVGASEHQRGHESEPVAI